MHEKLDENLKIKNNPLSDANNLAKIIIFFLGLWASCIGIGFFIGGFANAWDGITLFIEAIKSGSGSAMGVFFLSLVVSMVVTAILIAATDFFFDKNKENSSPLEDSTENLETSVYWPQEKREAAVSGLECGDILTALWPHPDNTFRKGDQFKVVSVEKRKPISKTPEVKLSDVVITEEGRKSAKGSPMPRFCDPDAQTDITIEDLCLVVVPIKNSDASQRRTLFSDDFKYLNLGSVKKIKPIPRGEHICTYEITPEETRTARVAGFSSYVPLIFLHPDVGDPVQSPSGSGTVLFPPSLPKAGMAYVKYTSGENHWVNLNQ